MSDLIWCCLSGFALAIVIIIQQGYKDSFFEKSLTFIPEIQEGASDVKINFWKFYTTWGLYSMNFLPFAVFYVFIK